MNGTISRCSGTAIKSLNNVSFAKSLRKPVTFNGGHHIYASESKVEWYDMLLFCQARYDWHKYMMFSSVNGRTPLGHFKFRPGYLFFQHLLQKSLLPKLNHLPN